MVKKMHSKEVIERSIERLSGLPEKPKTALTTRETVTMMRATIETLRARGYSLDEIEKHLSEDGLNIKKAAIQSALRPRKKRTTSVLQKGKTL